MVLEVILVFVYAGIEYARLFLATRGNKTETPGPLIISAVFSLGSIALLIYTLLLQIYVTRADVILSGIGLGFVGLELLLSVLAMLTFMRAPPGHAGS